MADTPKRIVGPVLLTTSAVTLYTVPASTVTIIRSIHVSNSNSSNLAGITMGIGGVAVANQLFGVTYVGANGLLDWSGFLVLNAAETIQALTSLANTLTLTVSGIEVS